jgi:hypothetical protein
VYLYCEIVGGHAPQVWLHDAKMTGLRPDSAYSYRVGSAAAGCGWSGAAAFSTAAPKKFVVLADFGHQRQASQRRGPRGHCAHLKLTHLCSKALWMTADL